MFVQVTPLFSPSVRVTLSNVPPFIPNDVIQRELLCFGKFASAIKMISLVCKNPELKHVMSFGHQVFMFLDSPTQTLDILLHVNHENKTRCFLCGAFGHI